MHTLLLLPFGDLPPRAAPRSEAEGSRPASRAAHDNMPVSNVPPRARARDVTTVVRKLLLIRLLIYSVIPRGPCESH